MWVESSTARIDAHQLRVWVSLESRGQKRDKALLLLSISPAVKPTASSCIAGILRSIWWLLNRNFVLISGRSNTVYIPKISTPDLVQILLPNQRIQRLSRLRREADHSSSPSAKINNEWNSTSVPSVGLHEALRKNFNFIGWFVSEKQKV